MLNERRTEDEKMINYPLTIKEVRRLDEGDMVWVEHRPDSMKYLDGPHMHTHTRNERLLTGMYGKGLMKKGSAWDLRRDPKLYGTVYRAWLRDTEPSEEDKAANPWREG